MNSFFEGLGKKVSQTCVFPYIIILNHHLISLQDYTLIRIMFIICKGSLKKDSNQ